MSRRTVFDRALSALAHPLTLVAIVVLILNALVLQPNMPSWWTGKIGDAAWLVFLPFLAAIAVSLMVRTERAAISIALAICGLGFATLKTIPSINLLTRQGFLLIAGVPLKLALDPTDLIVLPALVVAYWIWTRPPRGSRTRAWAALVLATAAMLADQPAPQNLGISCFAPRGSMIYAVNRFSQNQEFGGPTTYIKVFASGDGGASWSSVEPPTIEGLDSKEPCKGRAHDATWTLRDDARTNAQYVFLAHQGIYDSDDGGKTLRRQVPLDPTQVVLDAVVDPATGNVVATTGGPDVLVRSQGKWTSTRIAGDGYQDNP